MVQKGEEKSREIWSPNFKALTRARKKLNISYVNFRKQYNYSIYRSIPSRFLSELPQKNCRLIQVTKKAEKETKKLKQFSSTVFSIGEKVRHNEFGIGIILGISDNKLQIRFDNSGEVIKIFSDYVSKM